MKKIANITWITYHNYGTFLQAYALQEYIKSLGYQNAILNDESIILNIFNWKLEIKKKFWQMTKAYRMFANSQKESDRLFEKFKSDHLVLEENVTDIDYLNNEYDCFVCGSDQIWNPFSLRNPKAGFYYADFAKKKKVAYAPSIGVSAIPFEYIELFTGLIQKFQFLSAREKQGKGIMEKLTGRKVNVVVDPTLLLGRDEWNNIVNSGVKDSKKYVLGYFLTPNPVYINAAKNYTRKMGYEFRMLFTDKSYVAVADNLITAGPVEFLQAIRDAQFVFTDSFHGSIFSSIFKVQFITFKRFGNTITNQNSRVENLLRMMNIDERFIGVEDIKKIYSLDEIDFDKTWDRISSHIEDSKQYLLNALRNE